MLIDDLYPAPSSTPARGRDRALRRHARLVCGSSARDGLDQVEIARMAHRRLVSRMSVAMIPDAVPPARDRGTTSFSRPPRSVAEERRRDPALFSAQNSSACGAPPHSNAGRRRRWSATPRGTASAGDHATFGDDLIGFDDDPPVASVYLEEQLLLLGPRASSRSPLWSRVPLEGVTGGHMNRTHCGNAGTGESICRSEDRSSGDR